MRYQWILSWSREDDVVIKEREVKGVRETRVYCPRCGQLLGVQYRVGREVYSEVSDCDHYVWCEHYVETDYDGEFILWPRKEYHGEPVRVRLDPDELLQKILEEMKLI